MTCRNCGREINDGSVFCPHCGTTQALSPESPRNAASGGSPAWEGPEGGGKKKKTGLFIGIGVAVAAVIALVAVFAGGLFSNPKKQVEAAFVKSAAAYAQAWKKLGLPDTAQWQKDKSIFQCMSLQLRDINSELIGYDLSAFNGSEIGMAAGYSGEDRYMLAEVTASLGADELLHLLMVGDDAELYFNSPQFTGDTHYGVNTETLGADLTKMTGDDSMKDLSFNLFDLVDLVLEKMDQEKLEQDITAANKALWDQAEVKKAGNNKTQVIHGTSVKATAYQVTFPQGALNQYAGDLKTALSALNYSELYEEMFRSMGMPREEIQDFLDQLESVDPYGQLADGLRQLVDEIGDLTLDVRLSDGYVSGVLYEDEIDGHQVNAALFSGGGTEYVDDLGLELMVDDLKFRIDSTGDHTLRSNTFVDTTTIQLNDKSSYLLKVTSDLTLDPGKEEDNLRWKLTANDSGLSIFALDSQGTLFVKEDLIDLTLENAALRAMGMEVCSLRFNYRICRFPDWVKQPMEKAKLITRMDQMELMTAAMDVQERAEAWAGEMEELFVSRLPAELLYGMLY